MDKFSLNLSEQIGSNYYRIENLIPPIGQTIAFIKNGRLVQKQVVDSTRVQIPAVIHGRPATLTYRIPMVEGPNGTAEIVLNSESSYAKEYLEFWQELLRNKYVSVIVESGNEIFGCVERVMRAGDFPHNLIAIIKTDDNTYHAIKELNCIVLARHR